jgi:type I restriction enzyme S subunit
MNKIEELIEQLCPDGVKSKGLIDLAKISTGKLNANAMIENGLYPFFTCSEKPYKIDKFAFDTEAILISGNGSQVGHINYYKGKFNAYQRTYVLFDFDRSINVKFMLYCLKGSLKEYILKNVNEGSVPYITLPMLQNFQIPIPPLPIQQEIVSILDKFTQLEAELEAELEARRAQYEYYRNELLNFEGKEVEWKTMGEVGQFVRGRRFVKDDIIAEGIPCIHYGEMYTHYKIWAKKAKSFLDPALAAKLRVAHPGDVIIVSAGETIEDIGNGVAWLGDSDIVIHDACFTYSHSLNPIYVSYYLQTNLFRSQIKKYISSGKISSINAPGLSKARIPIPSLAEQERIVGILDKFDSLVNDISVGLPAEIQARRKQYEYYRGKLLDFKSNSNG